VQEKEPGIRPNLTNADSVINMLYDLVTFEAGSK
jgi:hypothetical protein